MYSNDTMSISSSTLSSLFSVGKSRHSLGSDKDIRLPTKICLVSDNPSDTALLVVNSFDLDVMTSTTGEEYLDDPSVLFVLEDFQGEVFDRVSLLQWRVLGLPALIDCADKMKPLPRTKRPVLSFTMRGVVTCLTGIMDKQMAVELMFYIRALGGSVRRDLSRDTTHLIACKTSGRKYNYAVTFVIPVMSPEWVRACWDHRLTHGVLATDEPLMVYRQKPFLDVFASFLGFPSNEHDEASALLERNGGVSVSAVDPRCTHIVADDLSPVCIPNGVSVKVCIVTAEWFWTCIQHVVREPESDYLVPVERFRRLPQRPSLKRRPPVLDRVCPEATVQETTEEDVEELNFTLQELSPRLRRPSAISLDEASILPARRESESSHPPSPSTPELFPSRRPSIKSLRHASISSGGLPSAGRRGSDRSEASSSSAASQVPGVSASSTSFRFSTFSELLKTEENYVAILDAILQMRSETVNCSQAGGVLLSQTEAKIIFGPLMPIARTHRAILKDLCALYNNWTEDANIGTVYCKYTPDLLRDYGPFVSSYEESRDMIVKASERSPRFHAFLKVCRGRPECGRQELHELMIRPVQRLGSCTLLLREILKHTPEGSPDRKPLELALDSLSHVLSLINEDKRKTELLCQVFDIFNVVDRCPADLIASHRSLLLHFEGVELNHRGLGKLGDQIGVFVFTDVAMVCKKKAKIVALTKGRSGYKQISRRAMKSVNGKPYKFIQILPLPSIRKIVDVVDNEGGSSVVGVIFRLKSDMRESCSFLRLVDGEMDKQHLVEKWSCALAAHTCVADPENFVQKQSMEEAGFSRSETRHKHSKRKATALMAVTQAFVNNAFSRGKSPSRGDIVGLPPCAMSSFNSTSRLETLQSASEMSEHDDDVFKPQASSLTATLMKRM